jgi:predicted membrane protein
MTRDELHRPIGVAIGAIASLLVSTTSLVTRIVAMPMSVATAFWIPWHVAAVVVAVNLWRLRRWAYWATLLYTASALIFALVRLPAMEPGVTSGHKVGRVLVLVIWLIYWLRSSVREAFPESRSA